MSAMAYQIKETEDGRYAVMEMYPVEIARFGSPTHAAMFVKRVLLGEASGIDAADLSEIEELVDNAAVLAGEVKGLARSMQDGAKPVETVEGEGQVVAVSYDTVTSTVPFTGFTRAFIEEAMARETTPLRVPPEPVKTPADPAPAEGGPSEDWEQALRRVARGEAVKAVAEEMGLSWTSLRARWSVQKPRLMAELRAEGAKNGQDTRSDAEPAAPARGTTARSAGSPLALPDEEGDVSGEPHKVARKAAVWTEEIDLALIDAVDDEAKLWQIAQETGATLERCKRRQDQLLAQVAKEMGS